MAIPTPSSPMLRTVEATTISNNVKPPCESAFLAEVGSEFLFDICTCTAAVPPDLYSARCTNYRNCRSRRVGLHVVVEIHCGIHRILGAIKDTAIRLKGYIDGAVRQARL